MKVVITGGAGFIGCSVAARHLARGDEVVILDNLSRPGADRNLAWLRERWRPGFERIDLRDVAPVYRFLHEHRDADRILHLAGQVAVTTSVTDPREDFESNALGTFNLLEAIRLTGSRAPLLYASTNKVYGGLKDLDVVLRDGRYAYARAPEGVDERRTLDFHSPYGCSKGAADQYVRDYHRIYGLKTIVFRQSCIYGYRQFGVEDQGWVAWFTIAACLQRPVTVYGDGRQVRDILFIDDLLDAFDAAFERIDVSAGRVYNIGGGPANAISILELIEYLERRTGRPLSPARADSRPGDQRIFVSAIGASRADLGWAPRVSWRRGLDLLFDWVAANRELFE